MPVAPASPALSAPAARLAAAPNVRAPAAPAPCRPLLPLLRLRAHLLPASLRRHHRAEAAPLGRVADVAATEQLHAPWLGTSVKASAVGPVACAHAGIELEQRHLWEALPARLHLKAPVSDHGSRDVAAMAAGREGD
eukprot:334492-Chlamydomonas_euryale.AAC.1